MVPYYDLNLKIVSVAGKTRCRWTGYGPPDRPGFKAIGAIGPNKAPHFEEAPHKHTAKLDFL